VHAEANAIISAARSECVGGTLYLAGRDAKSGELLSDATSCSMCRRMIITSGLVRVVVRIGAKEYQVVNVRDWIWDDDSLPVNITGLQQSAQP
jgi:dCMP deaminase